MIDGSLELNGLHDYISPLQLYGKTCNRSVASMVVTVGWKPLMITVDGTSKVKISRMQLLTSKYETLKMMEETITEYNVRVLEIANDSFNFGEGTPKSKLVKKTYALRKENIQMNNDLVSDTEDIDCQIENNMSFDQIDDCGKDSLARAIQKEKIQELMDENQRLLTISPPSVFKMGILGVKIIKILLSIQKNLTFESTCIEFEYKGKRFKSIPTRHPYAHPTNQRKYLKPISSDSLRLYMLNALIFYKPILVRHLSPTPKMLYWSLPHHNSDDSVFNPSDHLLPESEDIPETVASGDHNVSIRAPLSSPINDPNLSQPNPEDLVQASKLNVKSSKGLPVVTTKTGCQKLPLNIPSVPIDGISFHHEKNPQRWKYVVQQRIAYEGNVSNKYQSCVSVMDHISQAGLSRTILNV
ncbi:hypothetical protein Csa_022694 [Cucumis sativus]|nr:hypothetical protein Csa_022694 [Cucumis sativus]